MVFFFLLFLLIAFSVVIIGLIQLGFFAFLFSEAFLWWIYHQRYWLTLVTGFVVWRLFFRSSRAETDTEEDDEAEGDDEASDEEPYQDPDIFYVTPEQLILSLESHRVARGYKPGWLYHRCREMNLLDELEQLQDEGVLSRFAYSESDEETTSSEKHTAPPNGKSEVQADPYDVLGLKRGASRGEVKKAYYEMLKLYHPDRVHGLGEQLQKLAQDVTVQLNGAFAKLCKQNGWN